MPRRKFDKRKEKGRPKRGRISVRPKVCKFCANKKLTIDHKDGRLLSPFVTERGKIVPRRITGVCARHQRELTTAIKRARILAFIPFTATQLPL